MLFNSWEFWRFFLVVLALYYLIPGKWRMTYLLLASYFFYGFWKWEYALLLLLCTLVAYGAARLGTASSQGKSRKIALWLATASALAALIFFKYLNWLAAIFYPLLQRIFSLHSFSPWQLALPAGISFFTFKLVSYAVDVYHGRIPAENNFGNFALYVSFFPQILAGPIERAASFLPQTRAQVRFAWDNVADGAVQVLWGLFKKVAIADHLAFFVNHVFRNPSHQGLNLVFAAYFFAVQIYCDFSGYSDMAIGLARMLGFRTPANFNYPYISTSITQFWNRWHITLSNWLRDYLFLPITFAFLRRVKREKLWRLPLEFWGYLVGMFSTMFLGGLWHGSSWNFILWGLLHALFLTGSYALRRVRKRWARFFHLNRVPRLRRSLAILFTFNLVTFAWIFFRSQTLADVLEYLRNIHLHLPEEGRGNLLFNALLVIGLLTLEWAARNRERFAWALRFPRAWRVAAVALLLCLLIVLAVDTSNEFFYFRF